MNGLPCKMRAMDLFYQEIAEQGDSLYVPKFFWIDKIGLKLRAIQIWQDADEVIVRLGDVIWQGCKADATFDRLQQAINIVH